MRRNIASLNAPRSTDTIDAFEEARANQSMKTVLQGFTKFQEYMLMEKARRHAARMRERALEPPVELSTVVRSAGSRETQSGTSNRRFRDFPTHSQSDAGALIPLNRDYAREFSYDSSRSRRIQTNSYAIPSANDQRMSVRSQSPPAHLLPSDLFSESPPPSDLRAIQWQSPEEPLTPVTYEELCETTEQVDESTLKQACEIFSLASNITELTKKYVEEDVTASILEVQRRVETVALTPDERHNEELPFRLLQEVLEPDTYTQYRDANTIERNYIDVSQRQGMPMQSTLRPLEIDVTSESTRMVEPYPRREFSLAPFSGHFVSFGLFCAQYDVENYNTLICAQSTSPQARRIEANPGRLGLEFPERVSDGMGLEYHGHIPDRPNRLALEYSERIPDRLGSEYSKYIPDRSSVENQWKIPNEERLCLDLPVQNTEQSTSPYLPWNNTDRLSLEFPVQNELEFPVQNEVEFPVQNELPAPYSSWNRNVYPDRSEFHQNKRESSSSTISQRIKGPYDTVHNKHQQAHSLWNNHSNIQSSNAPELNFNRENLQRNRDRFERDTSSSWSMLPPWMSTTEQGIASTIQMPESSEDILRPQALSISPVIDLDSIESIWDYKVATKKVPYQDDSTSVTGIKLSEGTERHVDSVHQKIDEQAQSNTATVQNNQELTVENDIHNIKPKNNNGDNSVACNKSDKESTIIDKTEALGYSATDCHGASLDTSVKISDDNIVRDQNPKTGLETKDIKATSGINESIVQSQSVETKPDEVAQATQPQEQSLNSKNQQRGKCTKNSRGRKTARKKRYIT